MTTGSAADIEAVLGTHIAAGPVAAALAVVRAARGDDRGPWAAAAAALADDPLAEPRLRVAALLAAALLAQDGAPLEDAALLAATDDVVIDEVIAAGATAALTGVLAAAGPRVPEADRRRVAARLRAAGASGVHVAALLLALGELDRAARAAAPELAGVERRGPGDPAAAALAQLAAGWVDDHGVDFARTLAAALPPPACAALATAARAAGCGHTHALVVALETRAARDFAD